MKVIEVDYKLKRSLVKLEPGEVVPEAYWTGWDDGYVYAGEWRIYDKNVSMRSYIVGSVVREFKYAVLQGVYCQENEFGVETP